MFIWDLTPHREPGGWACLALRYFDSRFAGIKFNGLTPRLLQNCAGVRNTLTPEAVLVPFDVVRRSACRSRLPSSFEMLRNPNRNDGANRK